MDPHTYSSQGGPQETAEDLVAERTRKTAELATLDALKIRGKELVPPEDIAGVEHRLPTIERELRALDAAIAQDEKELTELATEYFEARDRERDEAHAAAAERRPQLHRRIVDTGRELLEAVRSEQAERVTLQIEDVAVNDLRARRGIRSTVGATRVEVYQLIDEAAILPTLFGLAKGLGLELDLHTLTLVERPTTSQPSTAPAQDDQVDELDDGEGDD